MKQIAAIVVRILLSAARARAKLVLDRQAEATRPLDYRRNAGGWN